MVKRPKVDSEALNRILPDTGSFAAPEVHDNGDLVQKITALKEMIDTFSGLIDSAEFKKLTCRDLN